MLNKIKIFENNNFKVKTKINNGEILLNCEDVLRAIKGKYIQIKNNKEYIRWTNVNTDLSKFNFPTLNGKGDFIPESAAYLLIMNGDNELALQFQMWLATEVIPSIRQYGAYITEDAKKEDVDKLEKFGKYRIKRTFSNATKANIQKLIDEFDKFIKTMSAKDTITALNSAIKGLETFKENNKDSAAYQFLIEEKLRSYTKLLLTKHNKVNGGIKATKTKQIKNLNNNLMYKDKQIKDWENYINSLYPAEEEFITIPTHPFSINSMYTYNSNGDKVKTEEYKAWIYNFPKVDFPILSSQKQYNVFLHFGALKKFDTDNLIKSTIDQIVRDSYLKDDNNIAGICISREEVANYNDGFIQVCFKEID